MINAKEARRKADEYNSKFSYNDKIEAAIIEASSKGRFETVVTFPKSIADRDMMFIDEGLNALGYTVTYDVFKTFIDIHINWCGQPVLGSH